MLGIVVAERGEDSLAGVLVGLGLIGAAYGLTLDGLQKRRASDDALAEALAIEEVESPTVVRLKALTEPGPERDRFRRWAQERS